jgi:hypothetical protein
VDELTAVFFSYSHKDEELRNELETHLAMLKRQGVISSWHDRRLLAGDDVDKGISDELNKADIVLLLVSADFLASDYCYGIEMGRALERHAAGSARVIPVILRPCDWHEAPFGKLLATPTDGKPVTKFANRDEAFLEVAKAIRSVAGKGGDQEDAPLPKARQTALPQSPSGPRSSNLRVRKTFTEHDKDQFLDGTFEFMARFFENSLGELKARNGDLETRFKRVDATRFGASIYRNGDAIAHCQIRLGGQLGGITFSYGKNISDNSFNESMSVEVGEQSLTLRALGMQMHGRVSADRHLSQEGAAEYYWDLFIEPLQR